MSFLVVNTSKFSEAHRLFDGLGINIVSGHRFLRGFIGPREKQITSVKSLETKWISLIDHLTQVAKEQPQAAYSALTQSIRNKWQFIQLLVFDCESCLGLLEPLAFFLHYLVVRSHQMKTIFFPYQHNLVGLIFLIPPRLGSSAIHCLEDQLRC